MNLQAAFNGPGNWIRMRGTPTEYNMKEGQYGPYALGKMRDDTGAVVDMMYSGGKDSPLPQRTLINTPCLWGVKFDANTQKYKALFNGFPQQSIPQNAPQTSQAPPQAVNAPNPGQTTYSQQEASKQQSIERQCSWKGACVVCNGQTVVPYEIVEVAAAGYQFIRTGTIPQNLPNPDPSIQEGPPDDDIPF